MNIMGQKSESFSFTKFGAINRYDACKFLGLFTSDKANVFMKFGPYIKESHELELSAHRIYNKNDPQKIQFYSFLWQSSWMFFLKGHRRVQYCVLDERLRFPFDVKKSYLFCLEFCSDFGSLNDSTVVIWNETKEQQKI